MDKAAKPHQSQAVSEDSPGAGSPRIRKRSVTIAGHRTSVSLEDAFWTALHRIAAAKEQSTGDLITQIDRDRTGNLSSAIRVFVLAEIQAGADR